MTNLRKLRLNHDISLVELETKTGVSNQFLSMLELQTRKPSIAVTEEIHHAIEDIIFDRQNATRALIEEYTRYKNNLFAHEKEE